MSKLLAIIFACTTVVFAILYLLAGSDNVRSSSFLRNDLGDVVPLREAKTPREEYVFIAVSTGNPYWIDARSGVEDAAGYLGVKGVFTGPQGSDVKQQVDIIETAIARQVNGIIVVPAEPEAVIPSINRAVASGIPVITVDTDSPNSKRYTFIGTGNYGAGLIGGELLAEEIGGNGEVALLMIPGQWNLEERKRGYQDALVKYPDITIAAIGNDRADEGQAASEAKSILQAHPNLAGFGCVDAAGGTGAAVAVRDAGKRGEVKIIAMDRNDATLTFIKQGYIQASLAQRSYTMAYLGLQMLYDLNHDRMKMVPDWRAADTCPLPAVVDTGTVVITSSNVDHFYH